MRTKKIARARGGSSSVVLDVVQFSTPAVVARVLVRVSAGHYRRTLAEIMLPGSWAYRVRYVSSVVYRRVRPDRYSTYVGT